MKERHIGQVSFNMLDGYEKGLHEHAYKKENGCFSQYIKRLIDRDREGIKVVSFQNDSNPQIEDEEDVRAAETFL